MFRLAFSRFTLLDLERDFVRLIAAKDSRKTQRVEQPLTAKIVWIEEAFSDRYKADMNSS